MQGAVVRMSGMPLTTNELLNEVLEGVLEEVLVAMVVEVLEDVLPELVVVAVKDIVLEELVEKVPAVVVEMVVPVLVVVLTDVLDDVLEEAVVGEVLYDMLDDVVVVDVVNHMCGGVLELALMVLAVLDPALVEGSIKLEKGLACLGLSFTAKICIPLPRDITLSKDISSDGISNCICNGGADDRKNCCVCSRRSRSHCRGVCKRVYLSGSGRDGRGR